MLLFDDGCIFLKLLAFSVESRLYILLFSGVDGLVIDLIDEYGKIMIILYELPYDE